FTGSAQLGFGAESVARLDISREGDAARFSAALAADKWPLLDPLARRSGGGLTLEGEANLADMARTPVDATLTAPAGVVSAAALVDLERFRLRDAMRLGAERLDLAFVAPPLKGKIDAAGTARLMDLTNFVWAGEATVTGLEYPSGAIARVAGPLTISKAGSSISWDVQRADIQGGRVTSLSSLAPADYTGSV